MDSFFVVCRGSHRGAHTGDGSLCEKRDKKAENPDFMRAAQRTVPCVTRTVPCVRNCVRSDKKEGTINLDCGNIILVDPFGLDSICLWQSI